jgi:hypothetical protein
MKIHNQNCKFKIDDNTLGIDIIIGICRLYIALLDNGFKKKDIDNQVSKVLKGMQELEKESESAK